MSGIFWYVHFFRWQRPELFVARHDPGAELHEETDVTLGASGETF